MSTDRWTDEADAKIVNKLIMAIILQRFNDFVSVFVSGSIKKA